MNKNIVAALFAVFITGCVSYNPIPDGYSGPLALLSDTANSISSSKAHYFQLVKVDGRSVETSTMYALEKNYGRGLSMTAFTTGRKIPVGKSVLSIEGVTYFAAPILALKGGNYSVRGEVEVEIKAEETYFVKGTLSKNHSAVWVENNQGNIVSKKVEKTK